VAASRRSAIANRSIPMVLAVMEVAASSRSQACLSALRLCEAWWGADRGECDGRKGYQ
jgi:hypothetical protein